MLQFGEPVLVCANQVIGREISCPHVLKHLLEVDAAVHRPDPFRFAALRLNLLQESLECSLVGDVHRQHFAGEIETLRGDDQSDDDLRTVGACIAAGTMAELVALAFR